MNVAVPQDFGAVGDGFTDDTDALRQWSAAIAGSMGFVPKGVYCWSDNWSIQTGTRIDGAGKSTAIFKRRNAAAQISNARPRWATWVDPVNGGEPIDHDISISNVCFAGEPDAVVPFSGNFITFVGVEGLTLRDVLFRDVRSDCLVLHNWHNVLIDACEFSNWGDNRPFENPGHGLYAIGAAIFCWGPGGLIRITNSVAISGGLGFWISGEPAIVIGNVINDVDEACLVGFGKGSIVLGNHLGRVRRKDVSGNNTEAGGGEYVYVGNYHADADGANAYFSNLQNTVIASNLMVRANQAKAGNTSNITLASHGAWAGVGDKPPQCVTIAGNVCCDEDHNATHAINVTDQGGGTMAHVLVSDNNSGRPEQWQGIPVRTERKGVTAVHN